jgi:hypothetical protein
MSILYHITKVKNVNYILDISFNLQKLYQIFHYLISFLQLTENHLQYQIFKSGFLLIHVVYY